MIARNGSTAMMETEVRSAIDVLNWQVMEEDRTSCIQGYLANVDVPDLADYGSISFSATEDAECAAAIACSVLFSGDFHAFKPWAADHLYSPSGVIYIMSELADGRRSLTLEVRTVVPPRPGAFVLAAILQTCMGELAGELERAGGRLGYTLPPPWSAPRLTRGELVRPRKKPRRW